MEKPNLTDALLEKALDKFERDMEKDPQGTMEWLMRPSVSPLDKTNHWVYQRPFPPLGKKGTGRG